MRNHRAIRYQGHVYLAADLTPNPVPTGAAVVAERDYHDDVRGLYRKGDRYYSVIKLKWHQFREMDEFTSEVDRDTAWALLVYIIKDGDPRKVKVDNEELETLQLSNAAPQEEQEFKPRGTVIDVNASLRDISGHYVRISDVPVYYDDPINSKEHEGEIVKIKGRFCSDAFRVLNLPYDNVPAPVINLFVQTLTAALQKQYPAATVDLSVTSRADSAAEGCFGYVTPQDKWGLDVKQDTNQIWYKIVFPVWHGVYQAFIKKQLPQRLPSQTTAAITPRVAQFIEQVLSQVQSNEQK
jgi:hypothetical protein